MSGESSDDRPSLAGLRMMDAIRAFAGDDPERAVVEPEARATLVRFDDLVTHYEVL